MNKLIETTLFMAENSVCSEDKMYCNEVCNKCCIRVMEKQNLFCFMCVFNSWKYEKQFTNIIQTIQLITSKQMP